MRRQRSRLHKPARQADRHRTSRPRHDGAEPLRLFGLHAAESALANPRRTVVRVLATENAAQKLAPLLAKRGLTPEPASPKDLDRLLGADTVHQGVILDAEPLSPLALDDVDAAGLLLVLDQVTD